MDKIESESTVELTADDAAELREQGLVVLRFPLRGRLLTLDLDDHKVVSGQRGALTLSKRNFYQLADTISGLEILSAYVTVSRNDRFHAYVHIRHRYQIPAPRLFPVLACVLGSDHTREILSMERYVNKRRNAWCLIERQEEIPGLKKWINLRKLTREVEYL